MASAAHTFENHVWIIHNEVIRTIASLVFTVMHHVARPQRLETMEFRAVREVRRVHGRPSEVPTDEALLRRVAARDETAFHLIYRRHAQAVMAVAHRILGDRETAAETTQHTFLRLWDHAASIEPREGRLRPWLLSVARNAAIDCGRRKRRGFVALARSFLPPAIERDPAETVIARASAREASDLLATLSAEQRTVVELAYFGELTQTQIAAVLGIPLGTVKSRLRLALQHLRSNVSATKREMR